MKRIIAIVMIAALALSFSASPAKAMTQEEAKATLDSIFSWLNTWFQQADDYIAKLRKRVLECEELIKDAELKLRGYEILLEVLLEIGSNTNRGLLTRGISVEEVKENIRQLSSYISSLESTQTQCQKLIVQVEGYKEAVREAILNSEYIRWLQEIAGREELSRVEK